MNTEIWKTIKNYENYEVSNFGNVRKKSNNFRMKLFSNNEGYIQVNLGYKKDENGNYLTRINKNGEEKRVCYVPLVHRLVAEAFIPNPKNLPEVNHKDENKANNCVENLEWCSKTYNLNYGTRNKKHSEYLKNIPDSHRKKLSNSAKNRKLPKSDFNRRNVIIVYLDGTKVRYDTVREASRKLGINPSKLHYNAEHRKLVNNEFYVIKEDVNTRAVKCIETGKVYKNPEEAAKEYNCSPATITNGANPNNKYKTALRTSLGLYQQINF